MKKFIIPVFFVTVLFWSLNLSVSGQSRPQKCILVFGAHADDVEPMAGGTFAKYIAEGYRGIYVCVINNFAGCGIESVGGGTTPPPEATRPLFTVSTSTLSYPVDALETMQIRSEEAIDAAAVFHAEPVFLDFHEGFVWFGRSRANIGSYEYYQYSPPGRQAVSLAEEEEGNVDYVVELLRKYEPAIVITHTLGGDKHDHGNSAYIMYLAFKRAAEKGIPVGKLWMKPKGWLVDDAGNPGKRGKPDVKIDVKDYVATKYEALNRHVSQKGTIRKPKLPDENTEQFITVIDNSK